MTAKSSLSCAATVLLVGCLLLLAVNSTFQQNTIYGLSSNNYFSFPFGYGNWKFEFQTNLAGYLIGYMPSNNLTAFNRTRDTSIISLIDTGTTDYSKSDYTFSKHDTDYSLVIHNPLASSLEFTKFNILQLYKYLSLGVGNTNYTTPALLSEYYFCPNCFSDPSINFATDTFTLQIARPPSDKTEYFDVFVGINKKATPNGNYDYQKRLVFTQKESNFSLPIENANYPLATIYVVVVMSGCQSESCTYSVQILRNSKASTVDQSALITGMIGVGLFFLASIFVIVTLLIIISCYKKKQKKEKERTNVYASVAMMDQTDQQQTLSNNQTLISIEEDIENPKPPQQFAQSSTSTFMAFEKKSPHIEDKITSLKSSFLQRSLQMTSPLQGNNSVIKASFTTTTTRPTVTIPEKRGGIEERSFDTVPNINEIQTDHLRRASEVEYVASSIIESYKSLENNVVRRDSICEDGTDNDCYEDEDYTLQADHRLKDRYVVDRLIGRGSFANVYLAFDEKTNTQVAIKSIRIEHYIDEQKVAAVREEGLRMIECKHPHIIQVLDVFPSPMLQSVCFVMQYYKHGDLKSFVEKHPEFVFSKKLMLTLIQQLADALFHLHEVKFITHNDLKPTNIFLDEVNLANDWVHVIIGDFGESTKHSPNSSFIQNSKQSSSQTNMKGGALRGTELFLAPELLCGKGELSQATDIWSLGCTLYQVLTGDFKTQIASMLVRDGTVQIALEESVHELLEKNLKRSKRHKCDNYTIDMILLMLRCHPNDRIKANELRHL